MTDTREPETGTHTVADQITDAALRIIDDEGWEAVSFRRLGAELNYGKSSILYYWPTRAALGAALARRILQDYIEVEDAAGYDPFDLSTWWPACLAVAGYATEKENRVRFASGMDDLDGSVRAYIDEVEQAVGGSEVGADRWASTLTARMRLFVEVGSQLPTLEDRARLALSCRLFAVDLALSLDGREPLDGYPEDFLDESMTRLARFEPHRS